MIDLVVFLAALLARLAHLWAFTALAFYRLPFGDAATFAREAAGFLGGGLFTRGDPFFQGPLYPLVLAAIGLASLPVTGMYWLQVVIGSVTAVMVARIARHLVRLPWAGLVAGLAYAFYDAAIFFDADLLAVSLVTCLAATALALTTRALTAPEEAVGRARVVAIGVLFALSAWGRPNLVLPVVLVVGWLVFRAPWPGARRRLLALSALTVLLMPLVRNTIVSGDPVFIASSGGVNFFIGNHSGATGTFRIPPGSGLANDTELDRISRAVASRMEGRPLSAAETSRYWFRRGLDALTADPIAAARLVGRKLVLCLNAAEIPNHLDLTFVREYSPALRFAPVRAWMLLALGAAGMWLLRGYRGATALQLFAAGNVLSILPFFVTARFRLPMMPVFAAFAGSLAVCVVHAALRRTIPARDWGLTAGVGVAVTALSLATRLPAASHAVAHVNLGALHAELGQTERARREFEAALALEPRDVRALENLAVLDVRAGRHEAALERVDAALTGVPESFRLHNLRGIALGELGRYDEALDAFDAALARFPGWPEARRNIELTWSHYLAHVRRLGREAGLPDPIDPESKGRWVSFLEGRGFRRAAERFAREATAG